MPVGEGNGLECAGHFQAAHHVAAHFQFRGNDHVDGHVVAGEQVLPHGPQIALGTDAGDLGRHVEQGVRHLAGDHVHFIGEGDGDDHIGLARAGALQHVRMGGIAHHRPHIEIVGHLLDQVRRIVDDGDVVVFRRQLTGNAGADLARAANDDFHEMLVGLLLSAAGGRGQKTPPARDDRRRAQAMVVSQSGVRRLLPSDWRW